VSAVTRPQAAPRIGTQSVRPGHLFPAAVLAQPRQEDREFTEGDGDGSQLSRIAHYEDAASRTRRARIGEQVRLDDLPAGAGIRWLLLVISGGPTVDKPAIVFPADANPSQSRDDTCARLTARPARSTAAQRRRIPPTPPLG
jgi:hypothetical protein